MIRVVQMWNKTEMSTCLSIKPPLSSLSIGNHSSTFYEDPTVFFHHCAGPCCEQGREGMEQGVQFSSCSRTLYSWHFYYK